MIDRSKGVTPVVGTGKSRNMTRGVEDGRAGDVSDGEEMEGEGVVRGKVIRVNETNRVMQQLSTICM